MQRLSGALIPLAKPDFDALAVQTARNMRQMLKALQSSRDQPAWAHLFQLYVQQ